MIPSIASAQAAHERHADFRRLATQAARASAAADEPGGRGRVIASRFRFSPRLRWSTARPRPA